MESSKTIGLTDLERQVDETWTNGKIPYFFDNQGNASTFYNYKGTLVELNKLQLGVTLGQKTVDDVKETLRLKFKSAMANGDTLAIFTGETTGKFSDYFDESYFPKEIFEPENIVKSEIYKKCVREDEDQDVFGNKGYFAMRDGFKVAVITTKRPDDEDNSELADHVSTDKFEFVKIE